MKRILLFSALLLLLGCQRMPPNGSSSSDKNSRTTSSRIVSKSITTPKLPTIALDDLLKFSDASLCELQPAGEALMDGLLISGDGRPITLGTVVAPSRYLHAFGAPSLKQYPIEHEGEEPVIEAKLPVSGTWHRLAIVEIYNHKTNFSDAWSYTFTFDEPYEKVRTTLNEIGFKFATDGKQPLGSSESAPDVELSRYEGRTHLSCSF